MSWRVWWVLRDYIGRTLGLWLLTLFAQFIQSATFWAAGIPRVPLLAVVIASLAYSALAEKPNSALRTLPITDTDGAVIRWWGSFGLPVVAMGGGIALAAWLSAHKGWIFPSALWLGTCIALSVAAVACSSAIGRAFSRWGTTSAGGYVAILWVTLAIVAIVGLPMTVLSAPILCLIFIGSLCLSAAACLPVSRSVGIPQSSEPRDRVLAPSWLRSRFSLRATAWTVMMLEVGPTTAIISVAAFIAATILHRGIAPWTRAALNGLVIWLVVSAIAVATGLSMRRWVETVYSLRILPITGHRLVFALYLAMILPGVLTCVALSTAHYFSPNWGFGIQGYMLVAFLPAPVALIGWQRPARSRPHYLPRLWGATIRQAVWPAWAGVFCSMLGLPFMPAWFLVYLAALAALFRLPPIAPCGLGSTHPQRWRAMRSFLYLCRMMLTGALAVGTFFVTSPASAQTGPLSPSVLERMDQVVQSHVSDKRFMGSVLVARREGVALSKGYGFANLEWQIPNTPQTKFRLGSMTKQFTAAAILMLQERGKLNVDDPVNKYLTEKDSQLYSQTAGQEKLVIFPEALDHFFYKAMDVQIAFMADSHGRVSSLLQHRFGRDVPAKRISDTVETPAVGK